MSIVTATFKTRIAAEAALTSLENIGISDEQVSLVVTDATRGKSFNIDQHNKADEGFTAGATAGGLIGAIVASLTSASAMAIPGLNLIVAGTAISALAGFGAGAASGGLIGALVGAGFSEHEAKLYEDEIKNGAILLAVTPSDSKQKEQVREILDREDAYNLAA